MAADLAAELPARDGRESVGKPANGVESKYLRFFARDPEVAAPSGVTVTRVAGTIEGIEVSSDTTRNISEGRNVRYGV